MSDIITRRRRRSRALMSSTRGSSRFWEPIRGKRSTGCWRERRRTAAADLRVNVYYWRVYILMSSILGLVEIYNVCVLQDKDCTFCGEKWSQFVEKNSFTILTPAGKTPNKILVSFISKLKAWLVKYFTSGATKKLNFTIMISVSAWSESFLWLESTGPAGSLLMRWDLGKL